MQSSDYGRTNDFLTVEESSNLFHVISRLKEQGITVIYISHRLDEIFKICDRAVVMRDGRIVGNSRICDCHEEDIIDMMTGKLLETGKINRNCFAPGAPVAMALEHISDGGFIQDISLKIYENEVLGIGGLIGSKRTELFRMVSGIDPMASGTITIKGKVKSISSPQAAKLNGLGYLSENRKEDGLSSALASRRTLSTAISRSQPPTGYCPGKKSMRSQKPILIK